MLRDHNLTPSVSRGFLKIVLSLLGIIYPAYSRDLG